MEFTSNLPWDTSFPLTQEYEAIYRPEGSTATAVSDSIPTTSRSASSKKSTTRSLACINCRKRKVKCHPSTSGQTPCRLCAKVGSDCVVPALDERKLSNSRKLISQLYGRIASLEAELEDARSKGNPCGCGHSDDKQHDSTDSPGSSSAVSESSSADNMISRLCGGQRQLNSDRAGRLRFFGPTSSLHLSESVTSSVLIREPHSSRGHYQWQDTLPLETQNHLLSLYWKYQHMTLPIIHKEAFLHDFDNGQTRYCSKLLVYCILTRAAAISDKSEIRALALAEDETNEDPPFLVKKCAELLDGELNNPGITTLQSLQLLSDIYCVICNDTKGWLDAGGACRLAFELGLHTESTGLTSLSQSDLEIRQIAFWSCFNLDRQWALYLGRPQMIKRDDITARKPEPFSETSEELKMATIWADLLEIVGIICDALNGVQTTKHRVASLDKKLRDWNSSIDSSLQYNSQQAPSIILLHMQYSSASILLHRPLADFGNTSDQPPPASKVSREICINHACQIAQYVLNYQDNHGSALSMSWIALHMIATATTTLIASLSETNADGAAGRQLSCLQTCIKALHELEKSHIPTRRVRRVVQQAMRILDLDARVAGATPLQGVTGTYISEPFKDHDPAETHNWTTTQDDSMLIGDLSVDLSQTWDFFDQFLPEGSQTDMLQSFQPFLQ